jgi:hypothetical protein
VGLFGRKRVWIWTDFLDERVTTAEILEKDELGRIKAKEDILL